MSATENTEKTERTERTSVSSVRSVSSVVATAAFTLRRMLAGKRFVAAIVIILLPGVVAAISGGLSQAPRTDLFHGFMIELGTYLVPILLSLVYAIAFTTGEIEEGTASLVLLAGLPKSVASLVQTVVTILGLSVAALLGIAGTWLALTLLGSGDPLPGILVLRYGIAAAAATACYSSVFAMFGYALRRGTGFSIAVAVIWEMMQVRMPVKFAAYTITNNVRALIVSLGLNGERGEHFGYATGYDFPTYGQGALFLSLVLASTLTLAMLSASRRSLAAREGE